MEFSSSEIAKSIIKVRGKERLLQWRLLGRLHNIGMETVTSSEVTFHFSTSLLLDFIAQLT